MIDLILLGIFGTITCLGITLLKLSAAKRLRNSLVCYRLRFPRGLDALSVEHCLGGLSGLLLPWWKRMWTTPFVIFEISADHGGIEHRLLVPASWQQIVETALQANIPSVRFEPIALTTPAVTLAAAYRLTSHARSLNINTESLAGATLFSLQPLATGQSVTIQWIITPAGPVTPVRIAGPKEKDALWQRQGVVSDGEAASALKTKQSGPLFLGAARIGVNADSRASARQLLRRVESAWHESRAPGVHLTRQGGNIAKALTHRSVPLSLWPGTYNAHELTGLIGWPVGASSIPGLVLGGCKQLAASPLIPTTGTVLAESTFPGSSNRPLALDLEGRLRHVHVLGPTGTGKSTLLVQMVLEDLRAGYGVILLDPKGDLVQEILERVPHGRRSDVVVLDPADTDRPVGLNPLYSNDPDRAEVMVENLVGLFKSLYKTSWGPRLDDILRAALMTLAQSGDATLCEVSLILTDPNYRRRLVGRLDDPIGLESFWGWYEALSDGERLSAIGPVLNKVRAFTMRPRVRGIIGQTKPTITMTEVLSSGKVLLCSLASGVLGDEAAALLGALIVAELWHAATARAGLPATQRRPIMAYLDEWQHFLHLPTPMASVLAEARGLGLGMTLAHQEMHGQLTDDVRHAVLANARSRILFQLPASDAKLMSTQLAGTLTPEDLAGLGRFEVACQLFAGGSTQAPVTGRTRPLPPISADADEIRRWSREHFGVDREVVESGIRSRQTGTPSGAFGRRRSDQQSGDDHEK